MHSYEHAPQDSKSALQEYAQKNFATLPTYTLIEQHGQSHAPEFTVKVEAGPYVKMAKGKHLYKLTEDGVMVGGAVLFRDGDKMNVGRIFVEPEHFRKGYGQFIMEQIEEQFPDVCLFALDTPLWNVRTNQFYQKLGYTEYKRDGEFAYYSKQTGSGQG